MNTVEYFDRIAKGVRGIEEEVRGIVCVRLRACSIVPGTRVSASLRANAGIDFVALYNLCPYIFVMCLG